jgi:pyrimidine-nucleoside phosphorylase
MRAIDIIEKKRDGKALEASEIEFLLKEYLHQNVPDYQMSAFLMAVYFNGMNSEELQEFTRQMIHSGEMITFENPGGFLIDKHSTGGVGDKTTIALAPLLAAFGISTTKLTGKGLGHTGGTIDKFESIPGFHFPENKEQLQELLSQTGIGIMGYSDSILPLDKKLYALRDVTGTVASIPLIASSIMSKKLAIESQGIILDVKVGKGAFLKTLEQARTLAHTMLEIGQRFGRKMVIHLSNMEEPLGQAVGNSLEVIEAIETLKGKGPQCFRDLIAELAATALLMKGDVESIKEGKQKALEMLQTELPLQKLRQLIEACGGNAQVVDDYALLPLAKKTLEVKAQQSGWISAIDAQMIGKAAMLLGAGRATKEASIDHSVGVILEKKTGEFINAGDTLASLYYQNENELQASEKMIQQAYQFSDTQVIKPKIIVESVFENDELEITN